MKVSDRAWCRVAAKTYCLIQQFQSEQVSAQLSSGRAVAYEPEQLVDMMIVPKSASMERSLKDLERQDAQTLWEIAKEMMVDPAAQMPSVDHLKIAQRLLEAFGADPRMVQPPMPPMPQLPPADGSAPQGLTDAEGNPIDPEMIAELEAAGAAAA